MYGDMSNNWSSGVSGLARLRFISNAFTRMRYCFPNGSRICIARTHRKTPLAAETVVCHSRPVTDEYSVIFGHWPLRGKGA